MMRRMQVVRIPAATHDEWQFYDDLRVAQPMVDLLWRPSALFGAETPTSDQNKHALRAQQCSLPAEFTSERMTHPL